MILSHEQLSAIYSEEENILISANAGTGKTTTLIEFAKEKATSNILYIVFNKSMKNESRKKFPINTEVHTINSFAYKYIQKEQDNREIINNLSVHFVINNIKEVKDIYSKDKNKGMEFAIKVIKNFDYMINNSKQINLGSNLPHITLYRDMIVPYKNTPITHNAMLKKFLDTFNFSSFKFEYILIDEAQDINPIMFKIINKINAKKVYVGDRKQSIYSFRDTIDIFSNQLIKNVKKYELTNSYRFGSNIANFINKTTSIAYNEDYNIKGKLDIPGTIIMDNNDISGPYCAYITRTNSHLFDKAFMLAKEGKKVSIPFNWEELKILIEDIFYLKSGLNKKVRSKILKDYKDFESLKKVSQLGGDLELKFLIKIIEKYQLDILDNLNILEFNLASPKYADMIFLTAHKSKGLEFFQVQIGEDFKKYKNNIKREERNLVYVAITRAIEKIKPNKDLLETFLSNNK